MSIIQLERVQIGEVGILPGSVKMITTDNLTTITTAGYLNSSASDVQLSPSDVIECLYSFNVSTGSGTLIFLQPSISNGMITLNVSITPGGVLLPVVSGDYASFNGTSGQIKDSGQAPSNASNPFAVTSPGSLTVNHIAQIADANGSIKDGGVLGTAASKAASAPADATVASVSGATVSGNLLKAADTAGTVADQGFAMKSVAAAAVAGGSAANTISDAFCTSGSVVIGNFVSQTNPAEVEKIAPGTGSFVVTSTADPGTSTFSYIITK